MNDWDFGYWVICFLSILDIDTGLVSCRQLVIGNWDLNPERGLS